MSEMIERVAKALFNFEGDGRDFPPSDSQREYWMGAARAAIEAMREPTDAMCEAADWQQQSEVNQYQYAIDAALRD